MKRPTWAEELEHYIQAPHFESEHDDIYQDRNDYYRSVLHVIRILQQETEKTQHP